ncbi:MAG: hypothetical protein IJG70_01235, partial [Kiritimatiellae bacterium]|nr:hypothetical protein [Kiritimatiellia bacterium]
PYAEAATAKTIARTGENKAGVADHSLNKKYKPLIGAAVNELFALFLMRVKNELSGCVVGQFSTLKHLMAPNFAAFRKEFKGRIEKSFLVPADTFDNVKGKFPIGFFVWRLGDDVSRRDAEAQRNSLCVSAPQREERSDVFTSTIADVYDRKGEFVGTKTICAVSRDRVINTWLHGFFDQDGIIIGWLCFVPNDFQHNNGVFYSSKPSESLVRESRVAAITEKNFDVMAVYLAVRHSMESTWLNDRDQFLFPTDGWMDDRCFVADCIMYALFNKQNRIMSADGVNHWIPFTEAEVDAKDRFASHFMSDYLRDSASLRENLSPAAKSVLDAGRELWRYYHAQPGANPNASFYDIRLHFQGATVDAKGKSKMNASSSDETYTSLLANLRAAMKNLAKAIEPKVYEYGFLKK